MTYSQIFPPVQYPAPIRMMSVLVDGERQIRKVVQVIDDMEFYGPELGRLGPAAMLVPVPETFEGEILHKVVGGSYLITTGRQ